MSFVDDMINGDLLAITSVAPKDEPHIKFFGYAFKTRSGSLYITDKEGNVIRFMHTHLPPKGEYHLIKQEPEA